MLIISRHPKGPRVYIAGQRLHHGASGIVLSAACLAARRRRAALAALLLVAHDAHDWRIWFKRERFVRALDELSAV